MSVAKSKATHVPGSGWLDGSGVKIKGPNPLAQLGVGGTYQDPKDAAKTWTIQEITNLESGAVIVRATS